MRNVAFAHDKGPQAVVVLRSQTHLRDRGWNLQRAPDAQTDLALISTACPLWTENHLHPILAMGHPVVLLDKIDGTGLSGPARQCIDLDVVKLVVKQAVLSPLSLYNEHTERWHVYRMGGRQARPERPVRHLSKIRLGFNFSAFCMLDPLEKMRIPEDKQIPISFRGLTAHGVPEVARHRREIVDWLRTIPGAVVSGSRDRDRTDYYHELLNSRLIYSPWGYGETTWRDYEGLMAGCLVIKPKSDWVSSSPDIYRDGTLVSLGDDESLDRWISLSNTREWKHTAQENRDRIIRTRGPKAVAARMAELFEEALGD